jgi:serine/threonine protein kinase
VIGQVLGHCRVVAKIGKGGMGVVYRAYDEVLHREVALKVVKKDARLDTSSSQRLLHEGARFFFSLPSQHLAAQRFFRGAFRAEGSCDLFLLQNPNYNVGTSKTQLHNFRSRALQLQ